MAEPFKDELHQAFTAYVKHAGDLLPKSPNKHMVNDQLKVAYIDPGSRLRSLVKKAEDSAQFVALADATGRAFRSANSSSVESDSLELKNFFRRSRFYLRAFSGEPGRPDDIFDHFWSAKSCRTVTTMTLRLIRGLTFESRFVDCGTFKIQRFTKDELDTLTEKETNEIFYPNARLNTGEASEHWFLVEEQLNTHGLSVGQSDNVYTVEFFKEQLKDLYKRGLGEEDRKMPDRAIRLLALHDWCPEEPEEGFGASVDTVRAHSRFYLPFQFVVNNDLLDSPASISAMPPFDPSYWNIEWVNSQQEVELTAIVHKGQKLLEIVDRVKPYWDFVIVAMGYLGKAFLTDLNTDQLLWNITVLEALLSDKASVMQPMRSRIGNILGQSEEEKTDIGEQFKKLYEFRSDLVHGHTHTKALLYDHLGKARDLARRVMVWFVNYLIRVDEDLRQRGIANERYPKRGQLLAGLDLDKGR